MINFSQLGDCYERSIQTVIISLADQMSNSFRPYARRITVPSSASTKDFQSNLKDLSLVSCARPKVRAVRSAKPTSKPFFGSPEHRLENSIQVTAIVPCRRRVFPELLIFTY